MREQPSEPFRWVATLRRHYSAFQLWGRRSALHIPLLLIPLSVATHAATIPLHQAFDPDRAMAHVEKQVQFGPRPSGSPELEKTRLYIEQELRSFGLLVREQSFRQNTPRGPVTFVNILAEPIPRFPSRLWRWTKKRIILASHYDTKWLPKIRFTGANDGGSSTGILLEIARVLADTRFEPSGGNLQFVFFDGEEAIDTYSEQDGLYGSRYFVGEAKRASSIHAIAGVILLDMVGDRHLDIRIPEGHPAWTKRILHASESLGFRDAFGLSPTPMLDDHDPFLQEGIPAIDLIDFNYGPGNTYWHTERDTIDKLSTESLRRVGQTVLKAIEEF